MDHVRRTISTYDQIASDYHLTSTAENRTWLEGSMDHLLKFLPGPRVLVIGCGEGRDSRYLGSKGALVTSIDLSHEMLKLAQASDPAGEYLRMDFRDLSSLTGKFDGVWACACLYHVSKPEFGQCLSKIRSILHPSGILYINLKLGRGECMIEVPREGYPGGSVARAELRGERYYAFYEREELNPYFAEYRIGHFE